MQKYTPEEAEKAAAIARYNAANGFGPQDPKIAKLEKKVKTYPSPENRKRPRREKPRNLTDMQHALEMVEKYRLKPLTREENIPPYDVTKATRYPEVVMWTDKDGESRLENVLKRYAHVMKPQGVTAGEFKEWRERFMLMNHEQLGALVRESPKTIKSWESGETPIPFSMWWVMHSTLQDPEYFLTRPGFHDFYIDYHGGKPTLCSREWPDIRYTTTDLYFNRCAFNEVQTLREEMRQQEERLGSLTAENTKLRQMLKAKGLTSELQTMHDQLGELMKKIQTADVMAFPEPASAEIIEQAEVIPLKQASA